MNRTKKHTFGDKNLGIIFCQLYIPFQYFLTLDFISYRISTITQAYTESTTQFYDHQKQPNSITQLNTPLHLTLQDLLSTRSSQPTFHFFASPLNLHSYPLPFQQTVQKQSTQQRQIDRETTHPYCSKPSTPRPLPIST